MKAYLFGENGVYPQLVSELKKVMDITSDMHAYNQQNERSLKKSDVLLKTCFTDVIILLDLDILNQKIMLQDGEVEFSDNIIENFKKCLWIGMYKNETMEYFIDKYNLNYIDISTTMPYFLTSKIALSEIILEKILQKTHKLAHQNKILIASYSDNQKMIADLLSDNKYIVIVSDKLLHVLIEAKNDGYGILLKEEVEKQKMKFDAIILDDTNYLQSTSFQDKGNIYFIDYKEKIQNDKRITYIRPFHEITNKYPKVMAESIASSIKKEIREYFGGE